MKQPSMTRETDIEVRRQQVNRPMDQAANAGNSSRVYGAVNTLVSMAAREKTDGSLVVKDNRIDCRQRRQRPTQDPPQGDW